MGIPGVLRYVLTHHKDPFSVAYSVLNRMHMQEEHDYQMIKYKQVRLPRCITEWQQGKKTNKQALKEIEDYIYTPDGASMFHSVREQQMINNIITTMFDAVCLTTYMEPIDANIMLVKELKEHTPHRLFLLSNFDIDAMETLCHSYPDFFSLFDGVVVSGQVGCLKPYPEIYRHLLDHHALDGKDSVFIDDQHENILGAERVGIPCILYKNAWQLRKDLAQRGLL
jgi:FMN phosphatase YigB (HAD superfamily)